jgi:L-fuculose-phosphate aldolase
LAWAGQVVTRAGLVVGSGGNLSERGPGGAACVITRAGAWLDDLAPADLSVVRISDGAVLAGHPRPSSEVQLHLHAYRAWPDVGAVLHLHPQTSVLLAVLGQPIQLITTDHVCYVGQVAWVPFLPPGSEAVARATAEQMTARGAQCAVLERHGCVVVADDLDLAVRRAVNLEEAAQLTYRAILLGAQVPPVPAQLLEWARRAGPA